MGDDTWAGCVTDCSLSLFSRLKLNSQHWILAYFYGKKVNKTQPAHMSSPLPLNYPGYVLWVHLHTYGSPNILKDLELWEKFESNLFVCTCSDVIKRFREFWQNIPRNINYQNGFSFYNFSLILALFNKINNYSCSM